MATITNVPFPEDFPVRMIGLRSITVDPELQARCTMSAPHERGIFEFVLKNGPISDPVVIFEDLVAHKNFLADGHHRVGAYRQAAKSQKRFDHIRAEIRPGTWEDAMAFAAAANKKKTHLPRTPQDIRNAVKKLIAIPSWFNESASTIAKHVGCSVPTVIKIRAAFCNEKKIPIPEQVKTTGGHVVPAARQRSPEARTRETKKGNFYVQEGDKRHYFGKDKDGAMAKATEVSRNLESQRVNLRLDSLICFLAHRGFTFVSGKFNPETHPGLAAAYGHDAVIVSQHFDQILTRDRDRRNFVETVACVLISREALNPTARPVVICYPEDAPAAMLSLAQRMGIEFLTPEDFVASLKPPEESHAHAIKSEASHERSDDPSGYHRLPQDVRLGTSSDHGPGRFGLPVASRPGERTPHRLTPAHATAIAVAAQQPGPIAAPSADSTPVFSATQPLGNVTTPAEPCAGRANPAGTGPHRTRACERRPGSVAAKTATAKTSSE